MEPEYEFENASGHPFQVVAFKTPPGPSQGNQVIVKDLQSGLLQVVSDQTKLDDVQPKAATELSSPDVEAETNTGGDAKALLAKILAEHGSISGVPMTDLLGYKSAWGSGGKYKHPHVKDLMPGQGFRDKGGNEYIYVQAAGGGLVLIWRPATGKAFLVSGVNRVRELDS